VSVIYTSGFDRVAHVYSELWSDAKAGRLQREAVWRHTGHLIRAGSRVLDLGCGTGDDALMLTSCGASVTGIDSSPEMVRVACASGVDARVCPIEHLDRVDGSFDVVWSNFGALNCVENPGGLRDSLAKATRPGGHLVVCTMNRVCAWETLWYLSHGEFAKSARRWRGEASSSLLARVFYPTAKTITRAFAPNFRLVARHGIGVAVPPSYVSGIANSMMEAFASFDCQFASLLVLRALGDHQLLIFRNEAG